MHSRIHVYAFSFHTTSQMKSLHYDQCLLFYHTYIYQKLYMYVVIFVASSRRNKTNPHHRNKFIPVLNATHLQAFKPKLLTYDQLLKTDQHDSILYVCVSWNIFNRIHFFAICDVFYLQLVRFYVIYNMIISKVDEAASTNFYFIIIYNLFHIANKLQQHSNTSRTIASSQYHPRETRPFFGQPNSYKKTFIGLTY